MTVAEVRDIAIVVLAAVSLVTVLVLVITAALLWRLIGVIRREVQPILKSTAATAATIKGMAAAAGDSNSGTFVRAVATAGRTRNVASFLKILRR